MDVYNVLSQLGQGTFGTVHLCERKHNKEKIVIKKINVKANNLNLDKAKNEVTVLKCLNNPNIIQFYDSFVKSGILYIVMEYANQGTLFDLIAKTKPTAFPPQKVMNFFCQILMGLNHIHSRSVIHRDLKCENIFLTGLHKDVIKIGDFGISKILQNNKHAQTVIGTCNYVAPEICNGNPYNIKSDIWSLGCILYEMCAMERMYEGTIFNVVLAIAAGHKKMINVDYYGTQIQQMIDMMLQVNPDDRPDTLTLMSLNDVFPSLYILGASLGCITSKQKFDFNA